MQPDGGTSRRALPDIRTLVVKVGTSGLVEGNRISPAKLDKVVREVARARGRDRDCVLVTSGAIAWGLAPLNLRHRPNRLPALQAAASVGQGRLMAEYARRFEELGIVAAQVLLTRDDFVGRREFVNAQRTFEYLLRARTVPVVNENDTVATDEITFGDNDRLAALVAIMVRADLLVLLSDVDGVFTKRPGRDGAELVSELTGPPFSVEARGPSSALGSGGMASKVEAADLASAAGIPTIVANASDADVLQRILEGRPVGTLFAAAGERRPARKAWMAFVTNPRGRIFVDRGAEAAVREAGKSILAAGVTAVEGEFGAGDTVEVVGADGVAFARGISSVSAEALSSLAEESARDSEGAPRGGEVIHRDRLVLTRRTKGGP